MVNISTSNFQSIHDIIQHFLRFVLVCNELSMIIKLQSFFRFLFAWLNFIAELHRPRERTVFE